MKLKNSENNSRKLEKDASFILNRFSQQVHSELKSFAYHMRRWNLSINIPIHTSAHHHTLNVTRPKEQQFRLFLLAVTPGHLVSLSP